MFQKSERPCPASRDNTPARRSLPGGGYRLLLQAPCELEHRSASCEVIQESIETDRKQGHVLMGLAMCCGQKLAGASLSIPRSRGQHLLIQSSR